ncbi:ammonium transporter Rh type C isoform X3 [Eurytemora carolleeae]|uniref:ammonium transporter Rh type C isoform X1 n=1 Tax=Eurytemora carolleeae TaxID=1294199 RepID=UPI000C77F696|nr:ammonium transporter Rh type C isoform X1 [Eurytemora carolleeae]XP_023338211.1 ammonium transporter Rh type C isoform X2 [Eurytemora carolleeae]XP_023338212.1 ammonium transporter Rh type C isoform X3 [Eurytemora carolleeae]|eukprot:XP_023338210.1 ammonium transporter Rh type C-like isoform X1 [Eurytemora affinis]
MPPLHLLLASLFFLPGQSLARCLQLEYLYTLDPGSSGPIQLYGTVFGFVSSLILFRGTGSHTSERKNNYIPSSVSLCGSFLLAFSSLIINSLGLPGQQVEFVILNTCLIQSTTITSAAGMLIGSSSLNRKPLDFQLLQGSLIAGGVSAGAVAATKIQPWGAACLGIGTGVLVVLAGTHVEPLISKKLGVPISYYTFSVHGLPALLGGLVAILMASLAEEKQGAIPYGFDLYELYPGRSYPLGQSSPGCEHVNKTKEEIFICPTGTEEISLSLPHLPLLGRSAFDQAAWQAVALALSIGLGTIFGVIGGLVGCFLDRLGGHGMPREAWYDSTCFLETSGFNLSPVLRSNTEDE